MDYILVQKVDDRITPRRLTADAAEAWYQNQQDCGEPSTILDIRENTMFGSPVLEELDMLLIVAPGGPAARLEYLRGELRAERISYGELAELQALAKYIDPSDTELLEAAGVSEEEYRANLARRSKGAADAGGYIGYEISPCKTQDAGYPLDGVEVCEEEDAEFFTIYGRLPSGEVEALVDRDDRESAEKTLARILATRLPVAAATARQDADQP